MKKHSITFYYCYIFRLKASMNISWLVFIHLNNVMFLRNREFIGAKSFVNIQHKLIYMILYIICVCFLWSLKHLQNNGLIYVETVFRLFKSIISFTNRQVGLQNWFFYTNLIFKIDILFWKTYMYCIFFNNPPIKKSVLHMRFN